MPRRIILDPNQACTVEMREIDPNQVQMLPRADDSGFVFPIESTQIDQPDDSYEPPIEIREEDFEDKARTFVDKLAAKKDSLKQGILRTAIGETPEIVHHVTTHLPFIGPAIAAVTFIQELDDWHDTWTMLQNFQSLNHRVPKDSYLKPTLDYVVQQLKNKKFKQEILLYGKQVQLCGSITTTCGIFTGGITLIPGIAISGSGSLIRLSVTVRSAIRKKIKEHSHILSKEREIHSAKLFALSIEHIKRKRHADLTEYQNNPAYERYSTAISLASDINSQLNPDEQEFSSILSAMIVRALNIKYYPGRRDANLETMPEYLRLGYYEIFNALKS